MGSMLDSISTDFSGMVKYFEKTPQEHLFDISKMKNVAPGL